MNASLIARVARLDNRVTQLTALVQSFIGQTSVLYQQVVELEAQLPAQGSPGPPGPPGDAGPAGDRGDTGGQGAEGATGSCRVTTTHPCSFL